MIRRPELCRQLLAFWLVDRCERGSSLHDEAGRLWDSWRDYARAHRVEAGTPAEFASELERRGYTVDQLPGERRRIRWGLRLRGRPVGC